MNRKTILKGLGYSAFSLFSCLLCLYLTFPGDAVGERISLEVAKASGGDVDITFSNMSLAGAGLTASPVFMELKGSGKEPTKVKFSKVESSVDLLAFLSNETAVNVRFEQGNGYLEIDGSNSADDGVDMMLKFKDLALKSLPYVGTNSLVPVQGSLSGAFSLKWKRGSKANTGSLNLSIKDFLLGPGKIKIDYPQVKMGDVKLVLNLDGDDLKISKFEQKGADLNLDLSGDITLRDNFSRSGVSGCVKVLTTPEEVKVANPKLSTALKMVQSLRVAHVDSKKSIHVPLKGTVGNIRTSKVACRSTARGRSPRRKSPR